MSQRECIKSFKEAIDVTEAPMSTVSVGRRPEISIGMSYE